MEPETRVRAQSACAVLWVMCTHRMHISACRRERCERRGLFVNRADGERAGARPRRWRPCSSTCWSPRTSTSCATARAWPRRAAAAAAPFTDAHSSRRRGGAAPERPSLAAPAAPVAWRAAGRGERHSGGAACAWQRPRETARPACALHDGCVRGPRMRPDARVTHVGGAALAALQWTRRRRAPSPRHCVGAPSGRRRLQSASQGCAAHCTRTRWRGAPRAVDGRRWSQLHRDDDYTLNLPYPTCAGGVEVHRDRRGAAHEGPRVQAGQGPGALHHLAPPAAHRRAPTPALPYSQSEMGIARCSPRAKAGAPAGALVCRIARALRAPAPQRGSCRSRERARACLLRSIASWHPCCGGPARCDGGGAARAGTPLQNELRELWALLNLLLPEVGPRRMSGGRV